VTLKSDLWPWPLKLNPDTVKVNHQAKYLFQLPFHSKVTVCTQGHPADQLTSKGSEKSQPSGEENIAYQTDWFTPLHWRDAFHHWQMPDTSAFSSMHWIYVTACLSWHYKALSHTWQKKHIKCNTTNFLKIYIFASLCNNVTIMLIVTARVTTHQALWNSPTFPRLIITIPPMLHYPCHTHTNVSIYPRPRNRTTCYKSFMYHALLKFQ